MNTEVCLIERLYNLFTNSFFNVRHEYQIHIPVLEVYGTLRH